MIHIRFLNDEQAVCENPARLDAFDSPVVEDFRPEDYNRCKECFALLVAHNKKAYEDEILFDHNFHLNREDPLAPARGVMWGVLFASAFWIIVGMILWAVFGR